MKPHIGLDADFKDDARPHHKLYAQYTDAVLAAGGVPVIVPSLEDDEDVLSILSALDGLVLTGGPDLDPASYNEEPHASVVPLAARRQRATGRLVELALVMEIPVLGICLGCQVVNVALGGTLIQDVPSQVAGAIAHNPADDAKVLHAVTVEPGSRLHSIVRAETIEVDSSHHQAIGRLGRNLVVSARSADGIIEAVEIPAKWVLAVQWHPERTIDRPEHLALFRALVAAAGG
jgi:gamma-glutamyl-gamma-aminobutyrate hydrolase PuuD